MGGWREEWENRRFETRLGQDVADWLRVRFLVERGTVLRFTVQYEAVVEGTTFPVVRWDTAHGFVHRDTLDWEGRVVEKLPVASPSYNDAMTKAIVDIRSRWPTFREEFAARKPR